MSELFSYEETYSPLPWFEEVYENYPCDKCHGTNTMSTGRDDNGTIHMYCFECGVFTVIDKKYKTDGIK